MSLPSTYNRLTYIQSSGTQYIDTGISPASYLNTLKVSFDGQYTSLASETYLFGAGHYSSTTYSRRNLFAGIYTNTSYFAYLSGKQRSTCYVGFDADTSRHTFTIDQVNSEYKLDDDSYTFSTQVDSTLSNNLLIFATQNQSSSSEEVTSFSSAKCYGFKIYNSGTLIRDFIPAKRNSDSEVGLYDLVNDVFYTNSGTGTFTAGYEIATSVNPSNSGSVEVECDGNDITLTATPSSNYQFVNWTENGTILSTSNPYTFTATADRDIVANFVEVSQITTSVNPSGYGTTTGDGTYAQGVSVTLNATPNQGYKFVNWTLNSVEVSTNTSYTFTMGSVAQTYVANFEVRDFIDCIYDRTQSDIDDKTSKAYLNISDWNRIENNIDYLGVRYQITNTYKDWKYTDIPNSSAIQTLLTKLNTLKAKVSEAPSLPTTILNYTQLNQVEYFLYFMYDFYIHRIQIISQPVCGFYNANEPNLLMAERN